jgi:hypothetical protein
MNDDSDYRRLLSVRLSEVCILPKDFSPEWRILLTPTLRALDKNSRRDASWLMKDLFNA